MKKLSILAAIAGMTAVGLGAFGAHALRARLLAQGTSDVWQTATLYHLIHAVAVLVAAAAANSTTNEIAQRRWRLAAVIWFLGIFLFSGSLYGLALGGPRWLGPITPLGGVAFLIGWFLVALTHLRPTR